MSDLYFIDEMQDDLDEGTLEVYADMEAEERQAIIDEEEGPGPGE